MLCSLSLVFAQDVTIVIAGDKATVNLPPISGGTVAEIPISSDSDFTIKSISIAASMDIDQNEVIIEISENRPMNLNDINGTVYNYISIDPGIMSPENIQFARIEFGVSKTWISENNIDVQKVGLLGIFEGEWSILSTEAKEEKSNEIVFLSEISDLSFLQYAIAGNIPVVITTTTTTTISTSTLTNGTTTVTTIPTVTVTATDNIPQDDTMAYIAIGVAVVAVVILIVIMRSSRKEVNQEKIDEEQL